jgi:N-acetyl-anhydromuramyl-L-alanine amidase AmpD
MAFTFPLSKLSFGTIQDTKSTAAVHKNTELKQYAALDLKKDLIQVDFPDNQYYKLQTTKNQIVIHHTVSGKGVAGDLQWWLSTADRIATHVVIDWQGKIYQCFSSLYWGHHLGVKDTFLKEKGFKDYATRNKLLNESSISVELDSWGGLIKEIDGKWYPALWSDILKKFIGNKKAGEVKEVVEFPQGYRGFYGFEKYTDAQIESLRKLLVFWCDKFKIPKTYNEDMWDVSMKALSGESHIWSHSSFRSDKSDVSPQPNLIAMLKSL